MKKFLLFICLIFLNTVSFCYAQEFSQLNPEQTTYIKCIPDKNYTNDKVLYFIINNNKVYDGEGKSIKNSKINKQKIQINYQNYNDLSSEMRSLTIRRDTGKYNSLYTINSVYNDRRGQTIGYCYILSK